MIRESQLEGVMADRVQEILPVYAVTPFTMLDYPGKAACIVWLAGCNMRCAYCHNPQIVRSKGRNEIGKVLAFLERRRGLLDGIVLSGGEATLYPVVAATLSGAAALAEQAIARTGKRRSEASDL